MARVLILDGEQRSALAAVRSLAVHGHTIFVASHAPDSIAGASRYCSKAINYEDPSKNPANFISDIAESLSLYNIDVMIPMTDVTVPIVLGAPETFSNVGIPQPDIEKYSSASDKVRLFGLASEMGFPIPETQHYDPSDCDFRADKIRFPIVIKPARSRIVYEDRVVHTKVMIANNAETFEKIFNENSWLKDVPTMFQEKVEGAGQGVFAVYDKGQPVAFFAHRRLREKPPQGGVSVLSESCKPESRMQKIAESLLTQLEWHGAAMVEFKVDDNGTPYLMEINGRLWGSLQLAVSAGFDVPSMIVDIALGKTVQAPNSIKSGIRNRWLLGDLDHLILQLRGKGTAVTFREKLGCVFAFLNFFDSGSHLEVFQWRDPKPFFVELRLWLSALFRPASD